MGLSGILLKRKDEINTNNLIEDIKIVAQKADLKLVIGKKKYFKEDGSFDFILANIANKFEESIEKEEFLFYICGVSDVSFDTQYDFIVPDGMLNQAIFIEKFSDCEKLLLDFVYEYLKLNPDDIFWYGLDWYYTLEDIEIVRNRKFDKDWPYIKPDWK